MKEADSSPTKLTRFEYEGLEGPIEYIETTDVRVGVSCDVYRFPEDDSRDLAIVTVESGCKTPLQRVVEGDKTIEGFYDGEGELKVWTDLNAEPKSYRFNQPDAGKSVVVNVGQYMQWEADGYSDLMFYEICEPPYEDGRFEDLA